MIEYPYLRETAINDTKLDSEIKVVDAALAFRTEPGKVIVLSPFALSQAQQDTLAGIVTNHDPSPTEAESARADGLARLAAFLDNRVEDLKYADYFYPLQGNIVDLWRDKPTLTNRYNAVIAALKANKDSDANHLAMWNAYLDMAQVEYGLTVTAGEIVVSGTVQQQASIARAAIECARSFLNTGVTMINELLLNQRL